MFLFQCKCRNSSFSTTILLQYTAEPIKTPKTNTRRRRKAREKVCAGSAIGFCLTSDACGRMRQSFLKELRHGLRILKSSKFFKFFVCNPC